MMENQDKKDSEIIRTGIGVIESLKAHGVKYIFGIPDGHTLPLYDGMLKTKGIDHILVNDERTAGFAADAYGRVTGTLGVCDAGAAGSMNFPVALSEALGAGSPVLALIGSIKSHDLLRNVPHDIKVAEALKPITKWAENVTHTENVPRFLDFAIRKAVSGRAGPTALIFPEDVLYSYELKLEDFLPTGRSFCAINRNRISPAESEIEDAVDRIKQSKQPVLFIGGGAITSGAFAEVKRLSEMLISPVFTNILGKGIMVDDGKNYHFGTVGLFGEQPNHYFLKKRADLVITIGNRLSEDDTANFKFPPKDISMIHIDIETSQIGLSYKALGVIGDPMIALTKIIEKLKQDSYEELLKTQYNNIRDERLQNIEILREKHAKFRKKDDRLWITEEPIKAQRVLKSISDIMNPEDYLVTDASASSRWIGSYFKVKSIGRKIITPRGVGPTGFGLGGVIGTWFGLKSLYDDDKMPKIYLLTGDGGIMNGGLSDLETLAKYGINCTIIVLNNSSLGFVKFGQALLFKRRFYETDRVRTNFKKIAETFGGIGYDARTIEELEDSMKKSRFNDNFSIIDVEVNEKELLPKNFY